MGLHIVYVQVLRCSPLAVLEDLKASEFVQCGEGIAAELGEVPRVRVKPVVVWLVRDQVPAGTHVRKDATHRDERVLQVLECLRKDDDGVVLVREVEPMQIVLFAHHFSIRILHLGIIARVPLYEEWSPSPLPKTTHNAAMGVSLERASLVKRINNLQKMHIPW